MGIFEPEIVLHAIDHVKSIEDGDFCWCVPREVIDDIFKQQRMVLEGFWSPVEGYDETGYDAAHYGKHDALQIGWGARVYPPELVIAGEFHPQKPHGRFALCEYIHGRHRAYDERPPFAQEQLNQWPVPDDLPCGCESCTDEYLPHER